MKRFILLAGLALFVQFGYTQIPNGYYDSADGLTGDQLKSALHDIIDGHNAGSYDLLWTILPESDEDPNNTNNFILLYTGRSIPKSSSYPDYNREHVWAKSHGDFGTSAPAGTDAHHLRPTDVSVNSDRGNKDFDNGGTQHSEATECYWDSDSWEPRDAVKGDVARMMFYMTTRYEGDVSGEPDLELVDYITGSTSSPIFGVLSTLLDWHYNDPVDDIERHRNEVVYSYQENRNPFIDHPEYVAQIWGGSGVFINEVEHTPINPTSADIVTVTATITSSGGTITGADLKWGTSTGSYPNTVAMSSSKGAYTGDIPAATDGSTIYYIIEASDDNAESATSSEYDYTIDDNPPVTLLDEDFSTCPASGWINYSNAGTEDWACGTGYMEINAYDSDVACDDWLISPSQNLNAYENEVLTFHSWTKYSDTYYPPVELKYSTDYSGSGDPSLAIWNDLTATFATEDSETWTGSGDIDVSAINGSEVYFAFQYTSSGVGAGTSAQWEIDDVVIIGNESTNIAPEISGISISPESPIEGEDVTVSATITDSDGTISTAEIKWGTSTGSYTNSVSMTNSGDEFSGVILSQSGGTSIYYVIEATDNNTETVQSEENSFYFNTLPEIYEISNSPLNPEQGEDVSITAKIYDEDGSIVSTKIKWGITDDGNYTETDTMTYSGADTLYSGTIPSQSGGTSVYYVIEAIDDDNGSTHSSEKNFSFNTSGNSVPQISDLSFVPTVPESDEEVAVTATITDADGTIAIAQIKWGTSTGIYSNTINLSKSTDDAYLASIPAQAEGTEIFFVIYAVDDNGGSLQSTEQNYTVNIAPEISNLNFTPVTPESTEHVSISATISDSDGTIATAQIKWGASTGIYSNTINLSKGSGDAYSASIPAQAEGTEIFFVIYAVDDNGGSVQSAEQNYTVNIAPEISNLNFTPVTPESTEHVSISATISDSDGTIATAQIKWGTSTGIYSNTINLSKGSGDAYSASIPAQAEGTEIFFVIYAVDDNGGSVQSTEQNYTVNIAPEISNLNFTPVTPESTEHVSISATISDSDGTIATAQIKWGTSTGIYSNTINLSKGSGDAYSASIPAQAEGTEIFFVIYAVDDNGGSVQSEEQSYTVDDTNILPEITNILIDPSDPESTEEVEVFATIIDSDGTIANVTLKWGTSSGSYTNNITMSGSNDSYLGIIPSQADGTEVYFVITAEDDEGGTTNTSEQNYTVEDIINKAPIISEVAYDPTHPTPTDNVVVSCVAEDPDGSVASALLQWKIGSSAHTDVSMNLSGGKYYGQIPPQTSGTTVDFTIIAEDNEDLQSTYDGSYQVSEASGLVDINEDNIRVYPNPAKEFITVQIDNYNQPLDLVVYDVIGSQVYRERIDFNKQHKISVEDLESGLYFISFAIDKTLVTKKILIKK